MAANWISKLGKSIAVLALILGALSALPSSGAEVESARKDACPTDLKLIAKELIELDLSGLRLPTRSQCLDPAHFRFVDVFHDPVQEERSPDQIVVSDAKITVTQIEPTEDENEFRAHFKVTGRELKDSILFMRHLNPKKQKSSGCASLLEFPKKWSVRKNCLPKNQP